MSQTRNLGQWSILMTAPVIMTGFGAPFLIYFFDIYGWLLAMMMQTGCCILDCLTSNATSHNLQVLEKNGFSKPYVMRLAVMNLLTSLIPPYLSIKFLTTDLEWHWHNQIPLAICVNLAATELLFWLSHRFMHQHLPKLHHLHHCCVRPSHTTNLIFDPTDLFIEFGGPIIAVVCLSHFVWKDPLVLLLSESLVTGWYLLDHDEYLRFPHTIHHMFITGNYTVYLKTSSKDPLDKVKALVIR
jgi:hypothetical protein